MATSPLTHSLHLIFAVRSNRPGYSVTLRSAAEETEIAQGEMPWPDRAVLESMFLRPLSAFAETPVSPELPLRFGCRLAEMLPDTVRTALRAERSKHSTASTLIHFHLAGVAAIRWFASLPWEFLAFEATATPLSVSPDFLALAPACHVIRRPPDAGHIDPIRVHPLKILLVRSDPQTPEYPTLRYGEEEIGSIQNVLAGKEGRIVLEVVRNATAEGLQARLKEFAPHVLHYIGHGKERVTGGVLAFHDGMGVREIYGSELARWLQASSVRLVVLSACHTASGSLSGRSVGQALLAAGVPAIVAMQLPVRDSSSSVFSAALYRRLAESGSITEAVWEARQAARNLGPDWGIPTLSLAGGDGALFELPPEPDIPRTNLPTLREQDLIGREQELTVVHALLAQEALLTLTGAGGIGKTNLALKAASDLTEEYADGVWMVKLTALTEQEQIPQALAAVLGVQEQPDHPLLQTLIDFLKTKRLLLLLDNCEHLLDGSALLVDALLRFCPGIRILATSRESLRVAGEAVYPVPSLSVPPHLWKPTAEELQENILSDLPYAACRLFTVRAKQQRADFVLTPLNAAPIAEICRRLDGIPLAIELAAARIRALSAEQIARRLEDRFRLLTGGSRIELPRHRTLRALVDWSYDLLEENEKSLFQKLSVFAEGWTLEMAEAVCRKQTQDSGEVLDLLSRLVDKSLILFAETADEPRYHMLETLRQYAWERLHETGEAARWCAEHRDYFLRFALEASPKLQQADQIRWLSRLETERANLRTALEWCAQENAALDAEISTNHQRLSAEKWLKLANALERFWYVRGPISEGRTWLERALTVAEYGGEKEVALVLNSIGILAGAQGDVAAAHDYHLRSLALLRQLGEPAGIAMALNNLSIIADLQEDYSNMQRFLEESLRIYRTLNNTLGITATLLNLGVAASKQEDYATAQNFYEESLTLSKKSGQKLYQNSALHNLADVLLRIDKIDMARSYLNETVTLGKDLGSTVSLLATLERMATIAVRQERYEAATRWLSAATHIREETGYSRTPANACECERDQGLARSHLKAEVFSAAWKEGEEITLDTALTETLQA